MPTAKPRVTITMTDEQLQQIEDLRFKKRFKNQTQTILALIDAGFEALNSSPHNVEELLSQSNDKKMLKKYHALDEHGKDVVDTVLDKEHDRMTDEYIEFAARGGKYKVKKEDAIEWAKKVASDRMEEDNDLC